MKLLKKQSLKWGFRCSIYYLVYHLMHNIYRLDSQIKDDKIRTMLHI